MKSVDFVQWASDFHMKYPRNLKYLFPFLVLARGTANTNKCCILTLFLILGHQMATLWTWGKDWLFLGEYIAKSVTSSIFLDNLINSLPSNEVINPFTETSLALRWTLAFNCFLIGFLGKCRQDQQQQQLHFIAYKQYISQPIAEVFRIWIKLNLDMSCKS